MVTIEFNDNRELLEITDGGEIEIKEGFLIVRGGENKKTYIKLDIINMFETDF